MKFLADENLALTIITTLRNAGFDVMDIKEKFRSARDREILEMVNNED